MWRIVDSLIFLVLGVLLLRRVWRDVRVVKASKSWPSVSGRVAHTSCREDVIKGRNSKSTLYAPLIQYECQVGGQTHRGTRIAFSEESGASSEKEFDFLSAFPAGHPVTVFYDAGELEVFEWLCLSDPPTTVTGDGHTKVRRGDSTWTQAGLRFPTT